MTPDTWQTPSWSLYDLRASHYAADVPERMRAVEWLLRLGSDEFGETEAAWLLLRMARPDLDDTHLLETVEELLQLGRDCADNENRMGGTEAYIAATDTYEQCLREFACPDDLTALLDSLYPYETTDRLMADPAIKTSMLRVLKGGV